MWFPRSRDVFIDCDLVFMSYSVTIPYRGIEIRALEEKIQIQVVKNVEAMKFIASAQ